jgi:hypothetical protein
MRYAALTHPTQRLGFIKSTILRFVRPSVQADPVYKLRFTGSRLQAGNDIDRWLARGHSFARGNYLCSQARY